MNKTKIEWVKNPDGSQGYTFNPLTGCLNHIDGMCKGGNFPCYAHRLANGRLKSRYLANDNVAPIYPNTEGTIIKARRFVPFYPRFWPDRIDKARLELAGARKPRGIFVCDMGELFGDWLPAVWREEIFDLFREFPRHRFYLLTKQPQNLIKFSPFPGNCQVGVTVTSEKYLDNALYALMNIEATKRFFSFEPLLERIPITPMLLVSIDGVIIGAQTKPAKFPEISWVQEIVEACDKAGVKVFLKENLRKAILFTEENSFMFQSIPGVPTGFKLRQELPTTNE